MRDPQVIAREIDHARHDLDESLGALKALVRDKLDIKQRVRHAFDRKIDDAREVVRRHVALAVVAACTVGALLYVFVRRRH